MVNQRRLLTACLATTGLFAGAYSKPAPTRGCQTSSGPQVETYVNTAEGLDVVSSLIIGSEAAVIIDLPWTTTKAKELAQWVKKTTKKPLVAAFSTHSHPDHYLSGGTFLDEFPGIAYYANPTAAAVIKAEAADKVKKVSAIFGAQLVRQVTTLPEPYNFTFFALPGDEAHPIQLLSPLTGDTVDETLFWVPSAKTLIAGDTIYGSDYHIWLADLATPALTKSWQATLELIKDLKPTTIVPGHTANNVTVHGQGALDHTSKYLEFWQSNIESKGVDHFTPTEISNMLLKAFPKATSQGGMSLLNATAENYGRGGSRQDHSLPLDTFTNVEVLDGWIF
ncbi:Metallo-beta-lactamase type 2 [Paramyrothecium foliicola]|nr:Metallo-beta-lactamase type 2 [Paramyrothecium foliicola]